VENTEQKGTLAGAKVAEETTTQETGAEEAAVQDIASNDIDIESEPGEAVLVNAAGTVDFIVEAKLAREEMRAGNKATLMEIVNNETLTEEEKSAAVEKIVEMTENAQKESEAETLIQAKGYENVAVTITDSGVDVMVVADSLDSTARAQIEEIVKAKAGVSASQITITAVKNIEK
jgi:stage III sporulation protein AH